MNGKPDLPSTDSPHRLNRKHAFEQSREKPRVPPINVNGVPAYLKAKRQFILWDYVWDAN